MANFYQTIGHFQPSDKVFINGQTQPHVNLGAKALEIPDFLVLEEKFQNPCKTKDAGGQDYNFNTVKSGQSIQRDYGRSFTNNPPCIQGIHSDHESTVIQTQELISEIICPKQQSKKRNAERPVRYAFLTRSETDILEDGYKWCKYGKKFVKDNPNPRSYYRCSDSNCDIKKTVQRDAEDKGIVITTYLGKHNHQSATVIYYNIGNPEVLQASPAKIHLPDQTTRSAIDHFSAACNYVV